MPIEFDCPQCHHRLRTPDGTEGRAAVCPNCSQQVTIPSASAATTPPPTPGQEEPDPGAFGQSPQAPTGDAFNPYAAPTSQTEMSQEGTIAELTPTKITASEILTHTWQTFRDNLMHFFLLGLILMAVYIGGYIVGLPLGMAAALLGEDNFALFWVFQVLNIVWSQVYGTICSAVAIRYCLSVTAGNQEPMQGAFNVLPYFVRLLFSQLLIVLMVYAAALVCFAPFFGLMLLDDEAVMVIGGIIFGLLAVGVAIFIAMRLSLATAFIIDRNQGIVEAITSSAVYTKGNVLAMFLAGLVIGLAMMVFLLFTCGLGSVLAFPFQFLSMVTIYRLATGQRTSGQSPFASQ